MEIVFIRTGMLYFTLMCTIWLQNFVVPGPLVYLPGCPCQYPSGIFYDDKIWDEKQQRYFRWRDVNGDSERMDVYKPGAAYCVRSLLSQGSGHAAAQHCCYDRQRRLLTRGSGAGTPNYVSPEISAELHERIDILPWRLCKGDFSRYVWKSWPFPLQIEKNSWKRFRILVLFLLLLFFVLFCNLFVFRTLYRLSASTDSTECDHRTTTTAVKRIPTTTSIDVKLIIRSTTESTFANCFRDSFYGGRQIPGAHGLHGCFSYYCIDITTQ